MKTRRLWTAILCLAAACGSDPKRGAGDGAEGGGSAGGGSGGAGGGTNGSSTVDDDGCQTFKVGSALTTPDMLIVLDRSASMAPEGNDRMTDRWRGSVDAVVQVTRTFDRDINFGLMTFPGGQASGAGVPMGGGGRGGRGGGGGGIADAALSCTPGSVNVEIGEGRGGAIADVLGNMGTGGFTPTAATLQAALGVIGAATVADQTVVPPKYVLLVTDGDPNCSGDLSGPLTADPRARQETIAAIERLRNEGVQTFVVGYQTADTSFASTLDAMAVAGGTGDSGHHSVESGADLLAKFEELAGRAISCSYKLGSRVDDPDFVSVTVAGRGRPYQDANDGWTLGPDMQTITLLGGACEAMQKGASFNVEVTCEPVWGI